MFAELRTNKPLKIGLVIEPGMGKKMHYLMLDWVDVNVKIEGSVATVDAPYRQVISHWKKLERSRCIKTPDNKTLSNRVRLLCSMVP